ncbi:MAG: lactate utilization protein B/C, partial [Leeuwenhoekiella sp.]
MSNLFKKIFSQKLKTDSLKRPSGKPARGKYMPDVKSPADERFTKHFILNGGKFLYCVDMNEVQESFDNILLENDWYENDVYCIDENHTSRFKGYNINYGKSQGAAFLFSTCENLVAD